MSALHSGRLPASIKVVYTLVVLLLVPVYWVQHGPANFLWFSDIALLVALAALWLENRFLASMMTVGVLIPEIGWNLDFFAGLLVGHTPIGIAAYMFDPELPLYLRALSGFHIVLPPLLIWMVYRLGYAPRAWRAQTLLAWLVLPLSRLVSTPEQNVNWVYGLGDVRQAWLHDATYVGLLMVLFPLIFYLPTHLVLKRIFCR